MKFRSFQKFKSGEIMILIAFWKLTCIIIFALMCACKLINLFVVVLEKLESFNKELYVTLSVLNVC